MPTLEQITTHAKTYGFLYPSSQIYQGIQAVYDYGPYGVMLKKKIQDLWWKSITRLHNNVVGLDAAILMHPNTWQASGHIEGFNDWMIDHKESKKRYRVDLLLEEHATKLIDAGKKQKAETLLANMKNYIDQENASGLNKLINQENIICPLAKNANWTKPKKRNLMLATTLGTTEQTGLKTYLRPETAQGIFVNFLSIQKTTRSKIPFGVAQIGKAFRNEIVARQFIFRMREFEQMEMQYFTAPNQQDTWFNYWKNTRLNWYHALNIPKKNLRIHKHQQLAHYARTALDIQYHFPFGYQEIEGIHARSDFDLKNHQKLSGKKLSYLDPTSHTTYIPHIVETSAGCDRIVLMLLCQAFKQEKTTTGLTRTYLQIPPPPSPYTSSYTSTHEKRCSLHICY